MLKFLTHKLRTHSLNEDQPHQDKADDDHDSGTESDDENGEIEDPEESTMESEAERSSGSTVSPDPFPSALSLVTSSSPYFLDSALPSDSDHNYDQHSSEEELEVINNNNTNSSNGHLSLPDGGMLSGNVLNTAPEKRKWSQVTAPPMPPPADHSSGSSDEEVQGLLAEMAPVKFRTSPPLDAHKPGRSQSPPPKVFHFGGAASAINSSPKKRHRHHNPQNIQRPCLDFEKMRQMKARASTTWRHNGEHGSELSLFCW